MKTEMGVASNIGANRVLVIKPEENRPLGRPRHRWEANVKVGGGHGLELRGSGQGQVVGSCECGNEPLVSIKLTSWWPLSFPWRTLLHIVNTLLLFIKCGNLCMFPDSSFTFKTTLQFLLCWLDSWLFYNEIRFCKLRQGKVQWSTKTQEIACHCHSSCCCCW